MSRTFRLSLSRKRDCLSYHCYWQGIESRMWAGLADLNLTLANLAVGMVRGQILWPSFWFWMLLLRPDGPFRVHFSPGACYSPEHSQEKCSLLISVINIDHMSTFRSSGHVTRKEFQHLPTFLHIIVKQPLYDSYMQLPIHPTTHFSSLTVPLHSYNLNVIYFIAANL